MVDAAIRTALARRIADQLAAGEIGDEAAAARTAVIEVSDAPLAVGGFGFGRRHGFREGPGGFGAAFGGGF